MPESNESGFCNPENVWEASQRLAVEFDLNKFLTPTAIRECAEDAFATVNFFARQQPHNNRIVGDILGYEFLITALRSEDRDAFQVEFELANGKKYRTTFFNLTAEDSEKLHSSATMIVELFFCLLQEELDRIFMRMRLGQDTGRDLRFMTVFLRANPIVQYVLKFLSVLNISEVEPTMSLFALYLYARIIACDENLEKAAENELDLIFEMIRMSLAGLIQEGAYRHMHYFEKGKRLAIADIMVKEGKGFCEYCSVVGSFGGQDFKNSRSVVFEGRVAYFIDNYVEFFRELFKDVYR